jgi:AcrR family transcriptional regulator
MPERTVLDEARRPGPRRPRGAPAGPDAVRRAILDAAAELFAAHGVDAVSLRDIAAAADVQLALIARYVGSRDDLIAAVFEDLTGQLAREFEQRDLAPALDPHRTLDRWGRVAAALLLGGWDLGRHDFEPVLALAGAAAERHGLDDTSARVRAAQVMASALGWRIFEEFLVRSGELDDIPIAELREDLASLHDRITAVPVAGPRRD